MQILEAVCDLPLPSAPVHAFDSDAAAPVKAGTSNRRMQDACHRLLDAGHQNEVLTVFHKGEPGAKRRVCVDLIGGMLVCSFLLFQRSSTMSPNLKRTV